MGTNITNNHTNDNTGIIVLGMVAIVAIGGFFALIMFGFMLILLGITVSAGSYTVYKCYELRVWKIVALASIDAGMLPPPRQQRDRQLPTVREFVLGRGDNA
jgi:hypothetical protein